VNGKKLIVVVGPTAVGKTTTAIRLARQYNTEIISADSRQFFRELEIGTAKPSHEELAAVKHHFINSHSIREEYDAGQYGRDALVLIHQLFERLDSLVLCGGSGLYIRGVLEGFDDMPQVPEGIRKKINHEFQEKGLRWLQEEVEKADPEFFSHVDQKNPHRLIRALELYYATGEAVTTLRKSKKKEHPFQIVKIGLELEREELYKRIDERMDAMIRAGLFDEAEKLYPLRNHQALQTVGYQEIFGLMEGEYDRDEAIRLLKRNSRRYAKRQMTWFKKDKEIAWYRPDQVETILSDLIAK
jgi:tRNA dimethylallyltransferase